MTELRRYCILTWKVRWVFSKEAVWCTTGAKSVLSGEDPIWAEADWKPISPLQPTYHTKCIQGLSQIHSTSLTFTLISNHYKFPARFSNVHNWLLGLGLFIIAVITKKSKPIQYIIYNPSEWRYVGLTCKYHWIFYKRKYRFWRQHVFERTIGLNATIWHPLKQLCQSKVWLFFICVCFHLSGFDCRPTIHQVSVQSIHAVVSFLLNVTSLCLSSLLLFVFCLIRTIVKRET